MSEEVKQLTEDIFDYGRLAIVAMFMIVIVFLVAQQLIGQVPATIGAIIIGLAFTFIYATNSTVRKAINSWAKKQK